ncbi:MAG: hypothetical protein GYA55_09175 [SAR324 cluster bacterium]|uniref:Lipoprotein n=1 Tax=SAR324 cluster bacterium TaxID=2024889 RepID=A0A7X9FT52_9DELT|nr:hypothetical protein [SAR324 cluster bacterium]
MKRLITIVLISALSTACSDLKPYEPQSERKDFFYPVRQLPPEPVYSRLKYVYLPDVIPEAPTGESANRIDPKIHLTVTNSTLERTAQALAETVHYKGFIAQEIAQQPYSCDLSGTVDEVAENISSDSNIDVVVDHSQREIRFLPRTSVPPRLPEDSNEHQSNN